MNRLRLDQLLVAKKVVPTRSQAESYIKLGKVRVDGRVVNKPGFFVSEQAMVTLQAEARYVSRAGLKLSSVAQLLQLEFKGKMVLDVGSSTGGFTDYALQNGARKVIAVDVGTEQLHPSLRGNPKVELYEKTDIRAVFCHYKFDRESSQKSDSLDSRVHESHRSESSVFINEPPDIIVIDVSFISLREIIPHLAKHLANPHTQIIAMVKPQFEAGKHQINKGVIKNDTVRRQILKDFEAWVKPYAVVRLRADSDVPGSKGNRERFYLLTPCVAL